MQNQLQKTITRTQTLADIFPLSKSELQNKHTFDLIQLQELFSQLYDQQTAQEFIFVNGIAEIVNIGSGDLFLGMGLENGVIAAQRRMEEGQSIYINGNHMKEEMVVEVKGGVVRIEGEWIWREELRKICEHFIKAQGSISGGIIYLEHHLLQDSFQYREITIISLFLSLLQLSNAPHSYTVADIVEILCSEINDNLSKQIIITILSLAAPNHLISIHQPLDLQSENLISTKSHQELQLQPNTNKSFIPSIKTNTSKNSLQNIQSLTNYPSQKNNLSNFSIENQSLLSIPSNSNNSNLEEAWTINITKPVLSALSKMTLDEHEINLVPFQKKNMMICCHLLIEEKMWESRSLEIKQMNQLHCQLRQKCKKAEQRTLKDQEGDLPELTEEELRYLEYYKSLRKEIELLEGQVIEFGDFLKSQSELERAYFTNEAWYESEDDLISSIKQRLPYLKVYYFSLLFRHQLQSIKNFS